MPEIDEKFLNENLPGIETEKNTQNKYKKMAEELKKRSSTLKNDAKRVFKQIKISDNNLSSNSSAINKTNNKTEVPESENINTENYTSNSNNTETEDIEVISIPLEEKNNTSNNISPANAERIIDKPQAPILNEAKAKRFLSKLDLIFIRAHANQIKYYNEGKSSQLTAVTSRLKMELDNLVKNEVLANLTFNKESKIYYLNEKPTIIQEFNEATKQLNFVINGDFEGVIIIQRMDSNNKPLIPEAYDILRYNKILIGMILAHPIPTQENSRIYNIACEFFKEKENIDPLNDNIYTRNNSPEIIAEIEKYKSHKPNKISPENFKQKENRQAQAVS